jgi:hypothetical protein
MRVKVPPVGMQARGTSPYAPAMSRAWISGRMLVAPDLTALMGLYEMDLHI